ncbi:MAG: hypothetical protein RL596_2512, partial [Bacteroidota bacterium]
YKADLDNELSEHEFDHVYIGYYNGQIFPNHLEVENYAFQSLDQISAFLQAHPDRYTAWFHIAFPRVKVWFEEKKQLAV